MRVAGLCDQFFEKRSSSLARSHVSLVFQMGHPGMHYAPMGMHPMGQRANMPPVPHGMMPQMMPPMGGPPMGQVRMLLFRFVFGYRCVKIFKTWVNTCSYLRISLCQNNIVE